MKLANRFFSFMAIAVLVAACQTKEEDLGAPDVTLGAYEMTFAQGSSSQTVTVTATRDWTASSDTWITVSPASGKASKKPVTVTVTVAANDGYDRTGAATFSVPNLAAKAVTVKQAGAMGEDTSNKPMGSGTQADPYNPAGAVEFVSGLEADAATTQDVWIKGIVSSVTTTYEASGSYGNASFYISGDGTATATQFYVFQTYYLGNKPWSAGNPDVQVGDEVIVCGKVVNFRGNTPETVSKGGSYVYSLNGETKGKEIDYDQAEAKTVAAFISAADKTTYYKLTGTVSGFNAQYCSFDLTDDTGTIYVYSVANKADWADKISNGGTVTLAGVYDYYATKQQHEVINAQILSFEAGEAQPVEATEATVAQALAAENDAVLKVGPALVVAAADAGFLMDQDGAKIYVYGGKAAVGDNVTVTAARGEYGGVPQLTNVTDVTVNSQGGAVTHPTPKDITANFDSYQSDTREYVTFQGKLSISGNYYNITVDGATAVTGSIVKPNEDIASLNGQTVTVTGYFLYFASNGKYLYVIATSITGDGSVDPGTDPGDDPSGETEDGYKISWDKQTGWTLVTGGNGSATYTSGDFTILALSNGNSNAPTVNATSGDFRSYAGATVKISTTGGDMTRIVFNLSAQGLRRLPAITASTGTVATQAAGDKTVTWTGSAKEVTFTVGDKAVYGSDGESKAGQFDFDSVLITSAE